MIAIAQNILRTKCSQSCAGLQRIDHLHYIRSTYDRYAPWRFRYQLVYASCVPYMRVPRYTHGRMKSTVLLIQLILANMTKDCVVHVHIVVTSKLQEDSCATTGRPAFNARHSLYGHIEWHVAARCISYMCFIRAIPASITVQLASRV